MEAAPDAIVIVDSDGIIAVVSNQIEKMFAYPRAELLGRPVEMLVPERYGRNRVTLTNAALLQPGLDHDPQCCVATIGRLEDVPEVLTPHTEDIVRTP